MKHLHLECAMGAAGDMLLSALAELLPEKEPFFETLNALGLPGVTVSAEPGETRGIHGLHTAVRFAAGAEATHALHDIPAFLDTLPLSETVRTHAKAIYASILAAEAEAHGCPVSLVHLHELGAADAVADVVGVCLLIEQLAPEVVTASPVRVGYGQVKTAHGLLPVPTPATAALLRGVPLYAGDIEGELCTPTGAALLRHFVSDFVPLPLMRVEKIGVGLGTRDFPAANCLRAFWGESGDGETETVAELKCEIDDMTPEQLAFACEELRTAGALDVFLTPITMKKGRAAALLTCVAAEADCEALLALLFRHSSTLGVRIDRMSRRVLPRSMKTVSTPYGEIRIKLSGQNRKPEYEDLAAAARTHGVSLQTALDAVSECDT